MMCVRLTLMPAGIPPVAKVTTCKAMKQATCSTWVLQQQRLFIIPVKSGLRNVWNTMRERTATIALGFRITNIHFKVGSPRKNLDETWRVGHKLVVLLGQDLVDNSGEPCDDD